MFFYCPKESKMTTQESRLVITIDTRNADKAVKELQKELAKLQSQGNKSSESTKNQGQQTQIVNNIVQNFTTTVNNNSKALGNNTTTVNNNSNALGRQVQSAQSASNAMKALAATVFAYISVSKLVDSVDTYTNLKNRLKLVTDTQQQLNTALSDTHKIAMTTSSDWLGVSTIYQRFAQNGEKLGLTQQRIARITETVSKAVSISGASAEGANAAMMQLGQALASGVLRGEEFNSVNEQTPAVLDAIAKGMGVQRGELRALAGDGKLTAEVLVDAFEKSGTSVDELFARTQTTIKGSLNMLTTEFTKYVGEADSGAGATKVFVESITTLAKNLETVFNAATVAGVGYLTKALITQTLAMKANALIAIQNRASHLASLQTQAQLTAVEASRTLAVKELTAMQLADAQATMARMTGMQRLAYLQATVLPLETRLTQATAAHAVALEADTLAQNANTAARSRATMVMGALGGVTGMLTLGVSALAAGYIYLKSKADETNDSFSTQITKVDELAQKYRELNTAKLVQEQELVNQKLKDFKSDATDAEIAISKLAGSSQRAVGKQKQQQDMMARIAVQLRDGAIDTDKALKQMMDSGLFTDKHIAKAQVYFEEFRVAKSSIREMNDQLSFITDQTGLFGNKTDEANKKLNNQKIILNEVSANYESLNKELQSSINWLLQQDSSLKASESQFKTVNKAVDDYNKGTLTASELAKVLRKQLPIESSTIKSIESLAIKTSDAKNELEKHNKEADKLPKTAEAGERAFKLLGQGAEDAKGAVVGLSAELEKLNKTQNERQYDAIYTNSLLKKGFSQQQAKDLLEAQKAVGIGVGLKKENLVQLKATWKAEEALEKTQDAIAEKERKRTEELKNQNKELKEGVRLVGLVGSTGKSTGNHLHVQYPKGSKKGGVTAEHLARFELGGKTLNPKNSNSHYGKMRSDGPHGGWDFNAPAGTPVTTNVGVKSVTKHIQKEGGKVVGGGYYSRVTFEDGVVIDLMHQIPEMMTKVKGGASKGNSTKSANDAYDAFLNTQKEAEQLEKERRAVGDSLITESLNYVDRLDAELGKKLQEVEFAIFDKPEHKEQMQKFYTERAKLQRDLFVKQQNYELDEWQLSEEQKLTAQHEINRIRLQLEIDYNEELMQERDKSQTAQYEKALSLNMLEIEKRKLSATEAFLHEEWAVRKRYDLERFEIQQTAEAHEKDFLIRMSKLRQLEESQDRINQASLMYANTIEMNDYQRLMSDRTSKESASLNLFSAELGRVDAQEQTDPNADQMELLLQREAILKAHNDRMYAIDQEYFLKKAELGVVSAQSTMGMWSGIFSQMLGEQSSFYSAAFALEKGFAVAKAMMNIPKTYSDTFASVSAIPVIGPYLAQPMAIAAAAGQVVQAGIIQRVQPTGFATGGLIQGAGTGTSDSIPILASNQEFMIKASSVKSIGVDNLNHMNKYGELPQQTQRVGQGTLNALKNGEANAKTNVIQQAPQVSVNPQIIITDERESIADYMSSRAGEQLIMRTLKRNGIAR